MKKSDVNAVLKDHGISFVKVQTGDWAKPEKCYTGWDGKKVKGIKGGSIGPMTVTSAYQEKNQEVINSVTSSLKNIGMVEKDGLLQSKDGKLSLSLDLVDYPAFTYSAGYDDSYRNYYVVPNFH